MDRDQAIHFVHELLRLLLARKGSDLFLTAEFPAAFKVDGRLVPVSPQALGAPQSAALVRALMNERQVAEFERTRECNFAIAPTGLGRFRVSAFVQQGKAGMVLRTIEETIPTAAALNLPPLLDELALAKRGIVLVVGATGSGKSTTLAAMVGYRNENSQGHIVTIEDPVEYLHRHRNCIVTQREVGVDCDGWEVALKNTLRQAPDVILIGEVRERSTMEHAVAFSETGHLVLCSLHANNTNQALDRIVNFFPEERRPQLLMDLSLNLRAIVSQRLIPYKHRKGRIPAVEILLNSPLVAELIFKGEVREIRDVIRRSRDQGMMTFDQALFDLHERELISYEDALRHADSVNDLRLQIKLNSRLRGGLGAVNRGIEKLTLAG